MKNEFIREKPTSRGFFGSIPFWHFFFPGLILIAGFMYAAVVFVANIDELNSAFGKPLFYLFDLPIFAPWMYPAWALKFKVFHPTSVYDYAFSVTQIYIVGSTVGAMVLFFILALLRGVNVQKNNLYGTARWATHKDLKKNGLTGDRGLVFGQLDDAIIKVVPRGNELSLKTVRTSKIIHYEGNSSTLLSAGPRAGKGVSVIIPTLLRHAGSVIILDLKGENFEATGGFRSTFSHVLKLSLTDEFSIKINPLMFIRKNTAYADANLIASTLLAPTSDKGGDNETAAHFRENAVDLLTACILHVLTSEYHDKTLGGVLDFISSSGILNVPENATAAELAEATHSSSYKLLRSLQETKHSDAAIHKNIVNTSARMVSRDPRERGGIFSTAYKSLLLFEDPVVRRNTSSHEFDFSMFVDSEHPISLYLTTPYAHIKRISPVLRLIISMSIRFFSEGETSFGNIKLKHRLLYLLDEFPALGKFPLIEEGLAVLPGYGVTFMIVCQSLNQITKTYGNDHSFFDQCKLICTFATGDTNSAKKFSDMIGMETVVKESVSSSGKKYTFGVDGVSHSEQELGRQLINPDEIIRYAPSDMLLLFQGMAPYRGKKIAFYDDPRFKDLAHLPGPKTVEDLHKELPPWSGIGNWYEMPPWMYYDQYEEKKDFYVEIDENTPDTVTAEKTVHDNTTTATASSSSAEAPVSVNSGSKPVLVKQYADTFSLDME